ncbi:MAG: hypothetical protein KatS3mg027_2573 [Bacteroidia bacterium]|nr:MAG: hypothetical protein KatS3mg027_2573 [Bacteroidia bacterium]
MKSEISVINLYDYYTLYGCNLNNAKEPERTSGSFKVIIDSVNFKSPSALIKQNIKGGKLREIFTVENNIYTVVDDLNHNIYIIKNFETLIDSLKFPEDYYKSNNAPFFTNDGEKLYFLTAYSGNLYKIRIKY